MTYEGTLIRGTIVLDGHPTLPDGQRVRVEVVEEDEDFRGPPPQTETYQEHLASLRHSIAEMEAEDPGHSLDEVICYIRHEVLRLPD